MQGDAKCVLNYMEIDMSLGNNVLKFFGIKPKPIQFEFDDVGVQGMLQDRGFGADIERVKQAKAAAVEAYWMHEKSPHTALHAHHLHGKDLFYTYNIDEFRKNDPEEFGRYKIAQTEAWKLRDVSKAKLTEFQTALKDLAIKSKVNFRIPTSVCAIALLIVSCVALKLGLGQKTESQA